ncbi:MAG: MFS transporter, partial [Candidatus Rokuibacteriota bacterium]
MLLAHPAFALLWCSRILANVAFNMLGVAVGWQLYELTGSALDLGLVGLAQFAPIVLLTLIVGQVADRYERRLIAAICQFAEAVAAAVLVAGSVHGWLSSTSIFTIVALIGAARAFENPTTTALVSDVVPRPLVPAAMAWLVSATQTARIVGPALGGFLYVIGPGTTYLTAAALFVGSGLCAALIRSRPTARTSEPVVLESVLSGIVFIRGQRVLLGTMSLDMFAVLLGGGATALLPIYARDILDTGPGGLGLLRAAPAVGALVTSILLAYRPLQW